MFVVDVRAMMRRSDRMGPPRRLAAVARGASRSGVAGFAPGPARQPARGSARIESPVRGRALWLLLGVLSSLAVGCGGTHDRAAPVPAHVRATPPADPADVVIQGPGRARSQWPLAASASGFSPVRRVPLRPRKRRRARGRDAVSFAASCVGRGCGSHPRAPRAPQGSCGCRALSSRPPRSWSPRSSMTAISPPTRSPRSSSGGPGSGRSPDWLTIDVPWRSPLRNESASAHSLAGCLRRPPCMALVVGTVVILGGGADCPAAGSTPTDEAKNSIPAAALAIYQRAGQRYDVDWAFLASIGAQECDHGRCAGAQQINSSGCGGPMQIAMRRRSPCSSGAGPDAVGALPPRRRRRRPRRAL